MERAEELHICYTGLFNGFGGQDNVREVVLLSADDDFVVRAAANDWEPMSAPIVAVAHILNVAFAPVR